MPYQFIKSILTLLAATFPVWILFRITINLLNRRRGKNVSFKKELIFGLFFLYVATLIAITIIPIPFSKFRDPTANDVNLTPIVNTVRELTATLTPRTSYMTGHFVKNILGNVALFVPLGIFLPLLSAKLYSLKKVLLTAFCCSLLIEIIQYISVLFGSFRSVDVDDIILNTLGAFLGFIIFDKILQRFFKFKPLFKFFPLN